MFSICSVHALSSTTYIGQKFYKVAFVYLHPKWFLDTKVCGGPKSSGITSFDLVYIFCICRDLNKTLVVCQYPVAISLMDPNMYVLARIDN